jgi:hypothetical protein
MSEDAPVEVGDGDVYAGRAEVGDEDVTGSGPERELARWPPAGARTNVALDHEPAFEQLADALCHDGPAQAGPGDQLGSGARSTEAHLVEDDDEGVEGLVGQRPADGSDVVGHAGMVRLPPLIERLLHLTGQSTISAARRPCEEMGRSRLLRPVTPLAPQTPDAPLAPHRAAVRRWECP